MKGIILLANHFEDVEALITIDMLRRAKITIDLVSMTKEKTLTTQSNIKLIADYSIEEVNYNDYDFLVIPGGKAVFETHLKSDLTKKIVNDFNYKNKLIATICAAPSILGSMGLFTDLEYVCFPGCDDIVVDAKYVNKNVVVTKNYISSKAAGTTFDFAYEIIKYLIGEEEAKRVLSNVYYIGNNR